MTRFEGLPAIIYDVETETKADLLLTEELIRIAVTQAAPHLSHCKLQNLPHRHGDNNEVE